MHISLRQVHGVFRAHLSICHCRHYQQIFLTYAFDVLSSCTSDFDASPLWLNFTLPGDQGTAYPKQEEARIWWGVLQHRSAQHCFGRTKKGLERNWWRWRGGCHRRGNGEDVDSRRQWEAFWNSGGAQWVYQLRGRYMAILQLGEHLGYLGFLRGRHLGTKCVQETARKNKKNEIL